LIGFAHGVAEADKVLADKVAAALPSSLRPDIKANLITTFVALIK
jgi:hypothetical protein